MSVCTCVTSGPGGKGVSWVPDQQGLLARPVPHGQSRPHLLPALLLAGASRGPRPRQAACGELSGATSGTPRPGRFGGWRQSCAISDTRPLPHLRPLEVTEGQEEGASLPPSGWIEQDFSRNAATIARGRRFRTQAARPPVKGTPHLPRLSHAPVLPILPGNLTTEAGGPRVTDV